MKNPVAVVFADFNERDDEGLLRVGMEDVRGPVKADDVVLVLDLDDGTMARGRVVRIEELPALVFVAVDCVVTVQNAKEGLRFVFRGTDGTALVFGATRTDIVRWFQMPEDQEALVTYYGWSASPFFVLPLPPSINELTLVEPPEHE